MSEETTITPDEQIVIEPGNLGTNEIQIGNTPGSEASNGSGAGGNEPGGDQPKRGRGRPRKDGSIPGSQPGQLSQPSGNSEKKPDLNDILGDYKKKKEAEDAARAAATGSPAGSPAPSADIASFINGETLLAAVSVVAPILVKTVWGAVDKRVKKIPAKALYLTKEEKKELAPAADLVAKEAFKNMPPWQQAIIMFGAIYAAKVSEALADIPEDPKDEVIDGLPVA